MKKYLIILFPFILIYSCGKKKESTKPIKKDIIQAVYASGKIYPLNAYNVYSKLPGYVSKIHIKVGDSVVVGQPLLTIKSEVSEKNMQIAKNQYDLATKNFSEQSPILNALKDDIKAAQSKYQLDSLNFLRYYSLIKSNAISQLQYDQAKTQYDVSKQSYQKFINNYNNTKNQLKIELDNAKLQYEAQQSNYSEFIISAATSGKVYDIVPKEGELVNSNILLMVIGDAHQFEVELGIDETDVSYVHAQQKVIYTIDAYGDATFDGYTKEIYLRINPTNKTCKVTSTINLDKNNKVKVFSGMSVEANIIVAERKQALVIPKVYLINNSKLIRKEGNDTITIEKGIEDLEFVEILKGVDENTEIIKP